MRDARNDERRGRSNVNPIDILEGFLLDDLDAATHPLTGSTTARIQIVRWDNDEEFYETDLIETVTNRSRSYSATAAADNRDEADILQIQFINGEWRPQAGGGGASSPLIEFQLTSVDCYYHRAIGIVVGVTCGATSPQLGDEVELYDDAGCFLTGDAFKLTGRRGFAQKMDVIDLTASSSYTYGCPYIIINICGEGFRC